jgi:pyrroline-5-carboxylate reductase
MGVEILFVGGGNMASAIIGGLAKQGRAAASVGVIDPSAESRQRLAKTGLVTFEKPDPATASARLVVWAVKPQTFRDAALDNRFHLRRALHLSVAAGVRSDAMAHWLGTERIVRAMPNTPALIGQGITGLFARPAVSDDDRIAVNQLLQATGELMWVADEALLDAVTALSGSGPAYVMYFIEAMVAAGVDMGFSAADAQRLAVATFRGASQLVAQSDEPPEILRGRVTSKGGTTHAAITSMEQDQVKLLFERAIHAARQRAKELGGEYGA